LAASLTTQIRAISEVATAVTKGDLTRAITVGAEGEVARLKDNINQMIFNLRETTQKNQEQDWLKTNLAKFSSMMQGQKNLDTVSPLIIIVRPVLFEGVVKAVIELASFNPFSAIHQIFLDQLTESIGVVLNMIGANMRTEQLLQQSQTLTQELQSQSRELTVQQEE